MESSGDGETETQRKWVEVQSLLRQRLIAADDFTWKLPGQEPSAAGAGEEQKGGEVLEYVGGVDLSYCKDDPSLACGALVVLSLPNLRVVHEEYSIARLDVPYVPGFLAFREAPVLLQLLEKAKNSSPHFYPQLIMVDGNGILHPRGFGLACHIGVLADCPTIGVGKNLHHIDGLTLSSVKQLLGAKQDSNDLVTLTGSSGVIWGAALRTSPRSVKPMFISTGHRVSLNTALAIVQVTSKYRVPEPIRQADIRSREYLQKHRHMF